MDYNDLLTTDTLISCLTEEERMKLNFQVEMMKSTKKIMVKFLRHLQTKLKSKYLFGSVLQFFKFLTDEPSE